MTESIWRGVHSAITTKLDEDENVDLDAVRADVALPDRGAASHAIVCCGSLGEASTLDRRREDRHRHAPPRRRPPAGCR